MTTTAASAAQHQPAATAVAVTAYLTVHDAAAALAFYTAAFGATELYRIPMPDGRLGHAEFTIGDTLLYLADEAPEVGAVAPPSIGGSTTAFMIETADADALFARALAAGATLERPLTDEPYGRVGWLRDPFGHRWSVITPNPEFDPASMG